MSSPPFIQLSLDFNAPHDRFIDSRGTTYIHINSGSGFRRYISSDGYPWTLWLRTLHLEPGCTKLRTAPALAMRGKNIKSYLRMAYNSKLCYVHRIVAQFFLNDGKPIPPGMQVDHLDGNIFNNAVSNLEIVTTAENYRRRNEKRGWKRMSAHRRNAAARNARKRRARIHATLTAQRHAAAQQNPTA